MGFVFLVLLTVGISLQVAVVKQPKNYTVVTNAAQNVLQGENPYAAQPRLDYFKYSPLAGILVAPFLFLPKQAGMFVFVIAQFWLFIWAFRRWATTVHLDGLRSSSVALVAFLSTIFDVTVSLENCQVNVGIFALMLLASAQYAEGKYVRAGLVLSLATNLKLFPFALALCFLTGFRKRYWAAYWGGHLLWLALPALFVGVESAFRLHGDWLNLMTWDQTRNLGMLDLGSFLELHFGIDPAIRNPFAVMVGFLIGLTTLQLFRLERNDLVNRFLLPINGLYVLIFSYLSESPTSVLATAGIFLIGVEALSDRPRSRIYWVLVDHRLDARAYLVFGFWSPTAWNSGRGPSTSRP